jgi:SCY1-like protein 1
VLATLNPLFFIAENFLDASTVGKQLGKVTGILFKVNDRAIRGTLLQKAPFMAESFDRNTLNEAVFEPMCSGFSDSSAALRELTLKATAALVPHLTHPNLEKLSRYLVRLQSDPESSIRTNTVIFFSKLAPYLTETTRQKMLLPAFERAMKDPFTPCRLAALKSTLKAKEFFDPMGIASRVLPAITPQLLDPSSEVRREALIAVDDLLFVLRQESERLNSLPEQTMGQPMSNPANSRSAPLRQSSLPSASAPRPPSAPSIPAPAPAKSGGFSLGITSWMSSSKSSTPSEAAPVSAAVPSAPPAQSVPYYQQQTAMPPGPIPNAGVPAQAMSHMSMNDNFDADMGDEADGWDDEDDLDVSAAGKRNQLTTTAAPVSAPVFRASSAAAPTATASSLFAAPASEDDFFGSFDAKPAKPVAMRTMGSTGSKLVVPSKRVTTKPAVQKLSSKNDSAGDGWDDF